MTYDQQPPEDHSFSSSQAGLEIGLWVLLGILIETKTTSADVVVGVLEETAASCNSPEAKAILMRMRNYAFKQAGRRPSDEVTAPIFTVIPGGKAEAP